MNGLGWVASKIWYKWLGIGSYHANSLSWQYPQVTQLWSLSNRWCSWQKIASALKKFQIEQGQTI